MAEQAYAYVTLIPVAKGFKSSIEKELGGIDGIGGDIGAKTGGSFAGGFGKSVGKLAAVAGGALAAVGVGQFFKESIKQSSDLGESINAVNKAYGDYADDVLKLGGDVANRLGLSTVDFNAAAVRFSAFAERVVGQGGDVAGFVDGITTRAADFASVFNIDVSEALQVFQSGLSGEAEPLKRFGINLLDSEVKAFAYANGIAKVGSELTETEKVQARYGLLLESTSKTAGDFADTSDGLANSQRILAANLQNLQATVGAGLTPVMATLTSALVPIANVIFPALANFLNTYIAPGLQRAADAFKAFAETAGEGGASIGNIFANLQKAFLEFIEGGGLERIFERMAEFRMAFFDAISKALPGIIDAFVAFIPTIVAFLIEDVLPVLVETLVTVIQELATLLVQLAPVIIEALVSMVPDLMTAALQLFESLVNALIEITPMLIDTVIELLPVIVKTLVDMLPKLLDAGVKLFLGLVDAVVKATPQIIDAVITLIPVITDALIKAVPQLIDAGIQLLAGLAKGLIDNAPRILGEAINSVGNTLVNGMKDFLGIQSPSKVFEKIGDNVGEGLVRGLENSKIKVSDAAHALAKTAVPPGYEWVIGPNGAYLERTSVTQNAGPEPVGVRPSFKDEAIASGMEGLRAAFYLSESEVSRQVLDIEKALGQQGYSTGAIQAIFEAAVGGTAREIISTAYIGDYAINESANQLIIGGQFKPDPGAIPSRLAEYEAQIAAGFVEVPKLEISADELMGALADLTQTIQAGQAANFGIPKLAKGGFVNKPTQAIVGEAGPEVIMPLDRFEKMMGMSEAGGKTVNYYAAPNQSIDAEQSLFQAMRRAKVVANW